VRRLRAAAALGLALAGCGDPRAGRAARDADDYIAGIQYRDAAGLIKRMAPFRAELREAAAGDRDAVRARWIARAEERFAAYDAAQATGVLPLAEDGIDLVQGLAIGKGIFYRLGEVRLEERGARAVGRMEVIPDYAEHRLRGLPPGTRVYVMGKPLGTLETITLGASAEPRSVTAVSRITLEWRFAWFDGVDVYPDGWAVESIRPVPGTVEWTELRRAF
jgi:hypothetical protein